ncbi:PTS fructose IIA subunit family protein [Ahniella affigens]|uniref:PTS fructose IIA subunit family protein n=1 Tax=Ahniella affigens TaxID=2021234 RepID=A0A2P1PMA2_9GAMM|nr:PTS fructose IIA subunit family protein [Ahniella affigens]AVP95966.1 PTS fructose IIA subunit family protein [Ahniella affigens]
MSVGVLVVTHPHVGPGILSAARGVLGPLPLKTAAVEVGFGEPVDQALARASAAVRDLEQGAGVLVLTDLYGATPSNIAAKLANLGCRIRRISGLNLPMLLRIMNYPEQSLDELISTATAGARNGVVVDHG